MIVGPPYESGLSRSAWPRPLSFCGGPAGSRWGRPGRGDTAGIAETSQRARASRQEKERGDAAVFVFYRSHGSFRRLSRTRFLQSPFLDEVLSSLCEEPQKMLGAPLPVPCVLCKHASSTYYKHDPKICYRVITGNIRNYLTPQMSTITIHSLMHNSSACI